MVNTEYETKEFVMRVIEEYKQMDPGGRLFVSIREKRDIRRSILNDQMDVYVLTPLEKQFIENMFYKRRETKQPHNVQRQNESPQRVRKDLETMI